MEDKLTKAEELLRAADDSLHHGQVETAILNVAAALTFVLAVLREEIKKREAHG